MPNKDMVNNAADKAYAAHSKDNTGLALEPKMPKAPSSEELQTMKDAGLPVPKATERKEEEEKEEKKTVSGILQDAAAASVGQPQQAEAAKGYALDAYDMSEIDTVAPPVDLFTLYNL